MRSFVWAQVGRHAVLESIEADSDNELDRRPRINRAFSAAKDRVALFCPVSLISNSGFWDEGRRDSATSHQLRIPSRPPGLFRNHLDLRLDTICRRLDSEVKRLNALPEFERATDQRLNVDSARTHERQCARIDVSVSEHRLD